MPIKISRRKFILGATTGAFCSSSFLAGREIGKQIKSPNAQKTPLTSSLKLIGKVATASAICGAIAVAHDNLKSNYSDLDL